MPAGNLAIRFLGSGEGCGQVVGALGRPCGLSGSGILHNRGKGDWLLTCLEGSLGGVILTAGAKETRFGGPGEGFGEGLLVVGRPWRLVFWRLVGWMLVVGWLEGLVGSASHHDELRN